MKRGHSVNTPTSSPWSPQQTNRGGNTRTWTHTHICTHTQTSSQACTNPRHLFFIITMQSAGGKVGLCYAAAVHRLSVWGGLSLTLGLKHESLLRSTGKTQRGAEREQWGGVVQYTSCAGTQLCPLQAQIHTHRYTQDCLWHKLRFIWFGCNLASTRQ